MQMADDDGRRRTTLEINIRLTSEARRVFEIQELKDERWGIIFRPL